MEIHWYQLLFQMVNFGVLIFILNRFLYRPILKIVEQRNKKIEDSIRAAEANLKEKEKIAEIKKQAVVEAEKEALAIIEAAKARADKTGKVLIRQAEAEAEAAVAKKMALLSDQLVQAEAQLKAKIGKLVISTTKQLLRQSLSAKEQSQVINRQIKALEQWS
jgi:F-type H+-transporting ATPase subunit b